MHTHLRTLLRFLTRLVPVLIVGFMINSCAMPALLLNPITFQLYTAGPKREGMRPLIPYVFQQGMPRAEVLARLGEAGFEHFYQDGYSRYAGFDIACVHLIIAEVQFDNANRLTSAAGYRDGSCI